MADSDTYPDLFSERLDMPAFEGASQDYRNSQRVAYLADADLLAVNELELLQARSRHLARNNPIASAAEQKMTTKLGAVTIQWKTADGQEHTLMQSLWDEFYADPCLDGKGNGNTLQSVWNHDRLQSGEAIARMLIQVKGNSNRVPLKIQNIESEYLPIAYCGDPSQSSRNADNTRYGITFGTGNKPKIYNFYKERYYGLTDLRKFSPEDMVKIRADDIIHIFERLRSNQWRGIPVLAPLITTLYRLDDLEYATTNKQIASSIISWIVERNSGVSPTAMGSLRVGGKNSTSDPIKKLFFASNGGSVQYTEPGETFKLVENTDIGNNLLGLVQHMIREISAGYGIPYYMLSGNTEGLSFASIRGILIELRDRLEFTHHFINIPDGLAKVAKRFKQVAELSYAVSDAYPTYQFPRHFGVDELKDTQGDILEVQAGFDTSENKRKERHNSFSDVLKGSEQDKSLGREGLLDVGKTSSSNNLTNGNGEATPQSSSN